MERYYKQLIQGKSSEWLEGFKRGIWMFAWWKDGEQYVGTTGTKLSDVMRAVEECEQLNKVHC